MLLPYDLFIFVYGTRSHVFHIIAITDKFENEIPRSFIKCMIQVENICVCVCVCLSIHFIYGKSNFDIKRGTSNCCYLT